MAKRKNNVAMVTNLMNFSNYGAVSQMFIMNAIYSAAEATAEADPKGMPSQGLVAPETWINVAKEIKEKMDKNWSLP